MPHEHITQIPDYLFTFILGLFLAFLWAFAVFLAWAWGRAWAWIDDSKPPRHNFLIRRVMVLLGFKLQDDPWPAYQYRHSKNNFGSDGHIGFFAPILIAITSPSLLLLSFDIYPVTICGLTLFAVAHLARFARRHKKLFDKHIADPNAHKQ
ncbi:hypothetical protein [Pseudomonas aeruginosa]|uniref:hypothetical protein n=1 Tax=Pseudomonas aeruginosa TaxID=287 RepID=UPI001AEBF06A|nr:hypothetical protein [Pseudomonas aeruginosa]MBP2698397.1 hypothetical protein [Pseudomonas aeruginosa]